MARPIKQGLDYFPMDVELDDKFELIEAKHGITGFGVLVKLYQRIYKEGYYLQLSEELLLIFSKRINVDKNKVNEVVNDCFCYQIFDKNLHELYGILTSSGIQKRYLNAIDRRKEVTLCKNYIITNINGIKVNINWINVDSNTQSKVKYSKVKKSKVKQFIAPTIDELILYFIENGYKKESAVKAFNYYSVADWHDSKGNKLVNWKQKMQAVWFKEENKIPSTKAKFVF
jgi:hypothetical protein